MSINARVTYIFNEERNGWSETWFIGNASDTRAAMDAAKDVAPARVQLLAKGANLEAIRVSNEALRGDSLLEMWYPTLKGGAQTADEVADTPWNCWLLSIRASDMYRRSMWLRGQSDDWLFYDNAAGRWNPSAHMEKMVAAFTKQIIKNGFCLRVNDKSLPNASPLPIQGVVKQIDGQYHLVVPAHGLTGRQSVTVRGITGYSITQINGTRAVFVVDADTLLTLDSPTEAGVPIYFGGGYVMKRISVLSPITTTTIMRPGKRDTGRRFFVTRGRRPKSKK